jgi:phosphatidylserine/phosphatidylglycerophosphate/cardiolipin synthase-like enzyme
LERLFGEARRSIRIIDYKMSDPWAIQLLRERQAEGIVVETLSRRSLGGLTSHGKLLLIDDTAALIGSLALSTSSLDSRRELAIVTRDRLCLQKLDSQYRHLASAAPGKGPSL